ncbi:hypothetical protein R3P38DRAFT_3376721 [Favolaschia claudopus]|uniref:Uncharacterized protein n=1 Tax=Favolaschia claudopus TaxID=2862362 RepID=A0AAV9ZDY2_9AGAR
MDRIDFQAPSLLRIDDDTIWDRALCPEEEDYIEFLGTTFFEDLMEHAVKRYNGDLDPSLRAMLLRVLKSKPTISRVLLGCGLYEQVPLCPFFGMDEEDDEPLRAFLLYLGSYVLYAPKEAGVRIRPWSDKIFGQLAGAIVPTLLNPSRQFRRPKKVTRFAQIHPPKSSVKKEAAHAAESARRTSFKASPLL